MHLLTDDVKKTQHTIRQAIRAMFCRQAERTRPHLKGIEGTKVEVSRKLIYKSGHPFRAELISLLCDGLWLNRKKWLAGLIEAPDCPFCPGVEETVRHLLYECPKWTSHWREKGHLKNRIQQLPPCASLCAHALREIEGELQREWGQVQTIMAHIVHDRMEHKEERRSRGQEGKIQQSEPALKKRGEQERRAELREWSFHYTERIQGGKRPWPYSRKAWQHFMWWAALLRTRPCQDTEEPTTILEAYVSFLLASKGKRLETGLGVSENGDWISVQLERFRSAWLSFQVITHATTLLEMNSPKQPPGGWGPKYGLPRLEILNCWVSLPKAGDVWAEIAKIPGFVAMVPKASRRADMWRRWEPGVPGSQMHGSGDFTPPRLWELPKLRISLKRSSPPWRDEVKKVPGFLAHLERWKTQGYCSSELRSLILEEGAVDPVGLQAITSALWCKKGRIERLLQHNKKIATQRGHFARLWSAKQRPTCIACGKVGYASRQFSWLGMVCPKAQAIQEEELSAILAELSGQLARTQRISQEAVRILALARQIG